MTDAADRVKKGADLLDRARPGWQDGIELDRLNIASSFRCILGQVYGEYSVGCEALGINGWGDEPRALAFLGDCTHGVPARDMDVAWRTLITLRRAARVEPNPDVHPVPWAERGMARTHVTP